MNEVSERSLRVLHEIVRNYVISGEPVASKMIAEGSGLGVSAATIRNDMVLLEQEELIEAPHTSSGRVPTDKGYRLYVDTLSNLLPLSGAQKSAIDRFLRESNTLDETMAKTVQLLSQLTHQAAIVQYPAEGKIFVRHIELVAQGVDRLLSILITENGTVLQQMIHTDEALPPRQRIAELQFMLASAISGCEADLAYERIMILVSCVRSRSSENVQKVHALGIAPLLVKHPAEQAIFLHILESVAQQLKITKPRKITVGGIANLSDTDYIFTGLSQVLEALEEQIVLVRLFNELAQQNRNLSALIGRENSAYGLESATLIADRYTGEESDAAYLGVIGPTRMDYAKNFAAVHAVAHYLKKMFE